MIEEFIELKMFGIGDAGYQKSEVFISEIFK